MGRVDGRFGFFERRVFDKCVALNHLLLESFCAGWQGNWKTGLGVVVVVVLMIIHALT